MALSADLLEQIPFSVKYLFILMPTLTDNLTLANTWPLHQKILQYVQLETLLIFLSLGLACWIFYKLALKNLARNRHLRLQGLFKGLVFHLSGAAILFALFSLGGQFFSNATALQKYQTYVGIVAVIWGINVFLKIARIISFQALFYNNMRSGVPLLLVNLITFLLTVFLTIWFLSQILDLKLGPVLATSAFFSVVLGLALQETIGNLFSGVALQFDKPFNLGDWIEVQHTDGQRWVGMAHEVSWRATTLIGFLEEVQIIPNRTLSAAHITNYSGKIRPVIRSHVFRCAYGTPVEKMKAVLLSGLDGVPGIRREPTPIVLIMESTESWLVMKLIYFIEDFGTQFITGDHVISQVMERLHEAGLQVAAPRLELTSKT